MIMLLALSGLALLFGAFVLGYRLGEREEADRAARIAERWNCKSVARRIEEDMEERCKGDLL